MEDSKTLGARIQAHRRRMGLSQEQLAERLGVSRQAVSKWELDESLPELDKALALCRVFGVSADMLLQGCEEPRPACPAGAAPQRRLMPAFGAALVVLGLVYICAAWYERQLATDIAIGMAIQAFGLILQGAAGLFEKASGHRRLWRANFALCTFVPASLLVTVLVRGYPRPYFKLWCADAGRVLSGLRGCQRMVLVENARLRPRGGLRCVGLGSEKGRAASKMPRALFCFSFQRGRVYPYSNSSSGRPAGPRPAWAGRQTCAGVQPIAR